MLQLKIHVILFRFVHTNHIMITLIDDSLSFVRSVLSNIFVALSISCRDLQGYRRQEQIPWFQMLSLRTTLELKIRSPVRHPSKWGVNTFRLWSDIESWKEHDLTQKWSDYVVLEGLVFFYFERYQIFWYRTWLAFGIENYVSRRLQRQRNKISWRHEDPFPLKISFHLFFI